MIKYLRARKPSRIKWDWGLFAAWAIPSGVMLLLFMVNGIYPFGDRSFLYSDMYHQYMPFFSEFVDKIRAGENLYYSWNVGIGSNFLALYVYYLASPLHWLAFLCPKTYLMEFMSYLVIVKIGLSGLCFCIYLRKHFQTTSVITVLFAVFYALSGYMAAYNWNIMWLDCVILFPIIILGLERLVREGKPVLYCVTLALSILTNYYISIMICIFLVLYFLMLIFMEERFLKPMIQFAIYSLVAGGLAAVLLVPEVCAIIVTDFGSMDFPKEIKSYFSVLDELARHLICVTPERQLEHWPNIYCGVAVLFLVPLYVICDKISLKKRFVFLALAAVILLSFSTNILDFIWHGLNYPDSLPARQSFIYIFLILVMCFEVVKHIREMEKQKILYCFLMAVVFLLFCEKFVEDADFSVGIEVLTLVFLVVYGVIIYYYHQHTEKDWQKVLCFVAFVVVVIETGLNMYNTSVGTVNRTNYLKQLEDYQELYAYAKEQNTGFFRMEKFQRKTKNDGALAGYPTASLFSSTMNSSVADFYEKVGMRHSKVYYCFDGATAWTGAILNVNYMFADTEDVLQHETPVDTVGLYTKVKECGDIDLYTVNYTLPFGYVVPMDYKMPEGECPGPMELQNEMVKELGIRRALFTKVRTTKDKEDIDLIAEQDAYYYFVISQGTSKIDMTGDSGTVSYKDLKNNSIVYAGYLKKGQQVKIENGDEEDDTPIVNATAYRMDTEVLEEAIQILSEVHMENVTYDSTHIEGNISMEKSGKVMLSVPYETGWTVFVNSEEVETGLFADCFMTIDLEPGQYHITMDYEPKGRKVGIIISMVSMIVFVGLVLINRRMVDKEQENAPEEESDFEEEC